MNYLEHRQTRRAYESEEKTFLQMAERYYDQVLAITEELGVTDQILIKGKKPIEVVAEHEAKYAHNMMYMPIVDVQKEKG